jgi:hypothetical protein
MSPLQRLCKFFMPRKWFEAAKAESQNWIIRCPCGGGISVWDAGGLRWKASTRKRNWPRTWMKCATCGERRWHTVVRADTPPPGPIEQTHP